MDPVPVSSSDLLALDVLIPLEIRDDPLNGSLRDADQFRDLAKAKIRILGQQK